MPKNFDTDGSTQRGTRLAQDGEFTLGGETFKLRRGLAVGSHALDQWRDVLGRMTAEEDERGADYVKVEDEEFLDAFRNTMQALLEPGQTVAFERILSAEAIDPIMIGDAFEVCFWAVGVVTGRPTDASVPSSNGSTPQSTEPDTDSSTVASSSPAAAASSD